MYEGQIITSLKELRNDNINGETNALDWPNWQSKHTIAAHVAAVKNTQQLGPRENVPNVKGQQPPLQLHPPSTPVLHVDEPTAPE